VQFSPTLVRKRLRFKVLVFVSIFYHLHVFLKIKIFVIEFKESKRVKDAVDITTTIATSKMIAALGSATLARTRPKSPPTSKFSIPPAKYTEIRPKVGNIFSKYSRFIPTDYTATKMNQRTTISSFHSPCSIYSPRVPTRSSILDNHRYERKNRSSEYIENLGGFNFIEIIYRNLLSKLKLAILGKIKNNS
jgi:hypothetical protein